MPSPRELDSGPVLFDAGREEGRLWMFFGQSPLVVAADDPRSPRLQEASFQPTQEQLASGNYWLDSHEGMHRWYYLESPDALPRGDGRRSG